MEFKLIIDASPELLKVLNALVSAFIPATLVADVATDSKPLPPVVPGKVISGAARTASANGHKKAEAPAPAEAPTETAVATEAVSIEQVRAVVQKQSQAGKREAIKTLLSEFGAESVTKLAQAQYNEFLTRLNAL